jgi:acyl-CoA synthetase (AMP-forming)/AMP-acid ligase II/acyl carrier protein
MAFLPTPLAESMIALEWPATVSLRFLLTGADRLQHYPPPTLPFAVINNYGPTEATVLVTSGRVLPTEHPDIPPPVGRPIANTQIYILDEQLRQVPIGEAGELYIGGVGLARDYLHRPALTNEKFIPNPFSSAYGARLYKTGDLACFLPDGQIAFLGRNDQQVKIRGHRVELGEIEAALNRHPVVQQAVVIAREDVPGEKRLAAYIVASQSPDVTTEPGRQAQSVMGLISQLRQTLIEQLPDYMIPTVFMLLDTLPLTPNGKVDRASLPAPDATNTPQCSETTAPTNPIEERLVRIMTALLNLEHVGRDDNFYMLGGHSLLGTQVIMRVSEEFGVDFPLRTLFEAPTVRQLAAEVERLIVARVEEMSDDEVRLLLEQGNNA